MPDQSRVAQRLPNASPIISSVAVKTAKPQKCPRSRRSDSHLRVTDIPGLGVSLASARKKHKRGPSPEGLNLLFTVLTNNYHRLWPSEVLTGNSARNSWSHFPVLPASTSFTTRKAS